MLLEINLFLLGWFGELLLICFFVFIHRGYFQHVSIMLGMMIKMDRGGSTTNKFYIYLARFLLVYCPELAMEELEEHDSIV